MAGKHQFHPAWRIAEYHACTKCGAFQLKHKESRKYFAKPCPGAEKEDPPEIKVVKK